MRSSASPAQRIRRFAHQLSSSAAQGGRSNNNSSSSSSSSNNNNNIMASFAPAAAPWRADFLSHIETMKPPVFTLSTLHPVAEPLPSSSSSPSSNEQPSVVPRARTVIFRGMWACLPVNPKNTADLNPDIYESEMVSVTTDARMEKVPELCDTAGPHGSGSGSGSGSGPGNNKNNNNSTDQQSARGGPVEAVFWPADTQNQWRLRGRAYIIGPDIDSAQAAPTRADLERHLRRTSSSSDKDAQGTAEGWSWARELTAHFGNLSPVMRGSFRNPPPGQPLSSSPGEGLGLGQKVEDLHDGIARANFRVLVIVPDEVDRVDLSNPDHHRRWNYKLVGATAGEKGSWKTTELWP